jgi:hypothetical protein
MDEKRREWLDQYFQYFLSPDTNYEKKEDATYLKQGRLAELGYLYRYRNIKQTQEQIIDPLREGKLLQIRASHPSDFNDPFDTWMPLYYFNHPNIRLQFLRGLCQAYCENTTQNEEITITCWNEYENSLEIDNLEIWKNRVCEILFKYWPQENPDENLKIEVAKKIKNYDGLAQQLRHNELGISCFSETQKSILMWSHYAEQHKGICLAYDTGMFLTKSHQIDILHWLNPVLYKNDISDSICALTRKADGEKLTKDEEDILNLRLLLTKAEDWSYEMEWRLTFWFPSLMWGTTPENGDNYQYFPIAPCCIYLGVKIDETLKSEIYELAGKAGIEVKEMRMADNKFELIVRE